MARMQRKGWVYGLGFGAVVLFALVGCRSSGGGGGGCGGGCCRGQLNGSGTAGVSLGPQAGRAAGALPNPATTRADVKPYGGQKTCPVMGEELGSMGPPIPVTVKGETVYVCCRGCAAKVQCDPDLYLTKVRAERDGR